ncbi:MAG: energy transducer TonB [Candidatus Kapaibacterium sp.]
MKKRVVVLARKSYGAFEMKDFIGKATLRSFAVTMSMMAALPMIFIAVQASGTPTSVVPVPHLPPTVLLDPPVAPVAPPPPANVPPPHVQGMNHTIGSGIYKAVDNNISEVEEIGSKDVLSDPTSRPIATDPGSGAPQTLGGGVPPNTSNDSDDAVIEVEQEPVINYYQLRQNLRYPDLARRSGVEGSVLIRVVVGIDGKPIAAKTRVMESTNELFNQAALDAVLSTTFTPAIQNKQPIEVPVIVPITFHLH